jgi:hypothetical protein
MIIDERTYTCHPGKLPNFLEVYEAKGKPLQWPALGDPLAVFVTDVGMLNQVVFWWRFENAGDRERRRATLAAAPGWREYLDAAMPFLMSQENRILVPTAFSPLKR